MTNFQKKIATAIATGALLLNTLAPLAYADTTIEISGNGSNSDSTANVTQSSNTTVVQTNVANINNDVDVDSDTGGNDANDNTGGDVKIDTGDADTTVKVNNTVNSNTAQVDCCAANGDTDVLISGNGTYSDNDVKLKQNNDTSVYQYNTAYVDNDVDVDSDTGNNDAEDNTGGDVTVETGDVDTTVMLSTTANANWAKVGSASTNGGSLSARIIGNGSNSDNDIKLKLDNDVTLTQGNYADINNDVDVDADTGYNDANDNTGGDVMIDTGDADTDVTVDNMVNFNAADLNCGCLLDDILAKISGNGTHSDNDIKAKLGGDTTAFQDNVFDCSGGRGEWGWWNHGGDKCADVDVDADTGNNDAEDNTAKGDGDPSIETGDADTNVEVNNSGNSNAFGVDLSDIDWPDFSGLHFSFTFDLEDLLDLLG